ncbi:MAG: hypothetical protein R6U11_01700 [Bacteroidales bacterium]
MSKPQNTKKAIVKISSHYEPQAMRTYSRAINDFCGHPAMRKRAEKFFPTIGGYKDFSPLSIKRVAKIIPARGFGSFDGTKEQKKYFINMHYLQHLLKAALMT